MRIFLGSLVAFGTLFGGYDVEPTEREMRYAVEQTLALYIRNALDFVAESGGPAALARIQAAGTDRFSVNTFEKLRCRAAAAGHVCDFSIDIGLVNGPLQQTMTGRFFDGPQGLMFSHDV